MAGCHSPQTIAAVPKKADTADKHTRINPQLGRPDPKPVEISDYVFLNRNANHIELNGADWSGLIHKFENIGNHGGKNVSIVHIGDSHIQADGNTGRVRSYLQKVYGNAGRGLMAPLRIAGTNQPLDYTLSTSGGASTSTLLKQPWKVNMGFTGVAVKPAAQHATFSLSDKSPFNILRIYANGPVSISKVTSGGEEIQHHSTSTEWGAQVNLAHRVESVNITISGRNLIVYGFDARDTETPGVLYHAIGNNGATFSTYSKIGSEGEGIALLDPDLVILSLGSNEAFGNISDAEFYRQIDNLVKEIREHNPKAEILLTTPSECQRSVYTTSRVRSKKKKRPRRVTSRSYQINTNVERLRNVILKYGKENNIPTYDFYSVAGGKGASAKWLQKGLLSTDRIHRTWNGYYLEGNLIYNALSHLLTGTNEEPVAAVTEAATAENVAAKQATPAASKKKAATSKKKYNNKKYGKKKKYPRKKNKRKKRR